MKESASYTEFAPAARLPVEKVRNQNQTVKRHGFLDMILKLVPDIILILNKERQIVYANESYLHFLNVDGLRKILGLRVGETLDCIYASRHEGGCGTTEYCKACGAVNAMLASQNGKFDVQECRITRCNGESLDLRVWASPLELDEEFYTFFVAVNIADEKRRRILERIFFHDILNDAGCIQGFANLLKEADNVEKAEIAHLICGLSDDMIDDIEGQRLLTAAEHDELAVSFSETNTINLLAESAEKYSKHIVAKNRHLAVSPHSENFNLATVEILIRRILGNMIKNALEASAPEETVTLKAEKHGEKTVFKVHNQGYIPREIQIQLFQRSFSTKSSDRGIGTYSIRFLTEKYLNGKVSFTSSPEDGTTFIVTIPPHAGKTRDISEE